MLCCRSMRRECLQMARRHQAALVVLYLQCEVETAVARNAARPVAAQVRD